MNGVSSHITGTNEIKEVLMKKIVIICALFICTAFAGNTVYIIPFPGFEKNDALFNLSERDECLKAFYCLRQALQEKGFNVKITTLSAPVDDVAFILAFDVPPYPNALENIARYNPEQTILFLWEPPTVKSYNYSKKYHEPFGKVYTLLDALVDNQRYFKFFYPQPRMHMLENPPAFASKKLCTLIACNKQSSYPLELYSERLKVIAFFEEKNADDFDFYGFGWQQEQYKNFKGDVPCKLNCLQNYRFSICYENMRDVPGYVTEKIFDSFFAGCVPVYWGANNIAHYIPKSCFIDRRDFGSMQELYDYLRAMNEEEYNRYLRNIRGFLQSSYAEVFSIEHFIKTVFEAMNIL